MLWRNRFGEDNVSSGGDEPTRRSGGTAALFPHAAVALHREPEGEADRHGSVWRIALSGPCAGVLYVSFDYIDGPTSDEFSPS